MCLQPSSFLTLKYMMTLDQVIQIDKTRSAEMIMLSEFASIVTGVIKEFLPLFRILLVPVKNQIVPLIGTIARCHTTLDLLPGLHLLFHKKSYL
jgi:hypothetical protein